MLAMQYQITLPADYDMGVIRERVAGGGPLLDEYEGLGMKAFLIRQRGQAGSEVNQYAPFYLWADAAAAASFLWAGDGFQGIVRDFGRPTVQTWIGGILQRGPSFHATPRVTFRMTASLPPDLDPAISAEHMTAYVQALAREPSLHSAAYAIDPRTWESVTPGEVLALLAAVRRHPRHRFLSDDSSLAAPAISVGRLATARQTTDLYLVNLCAVHWVVLVTLDRGITEMLEPTDRRHVVVLEPAA